ncbi:class I fructose-bisphosphate aldolase [Parasphingorhabdus pacifica]
MNNLAEKARALVAPGKGILAADESTGTMNKRLAEVGVDTTEESRRRFRELIVTTPELGRWISGVILFDETFRQRSSDGTPLVESARQTGVIPGIKVDTGAKPLAGSAGETVTEGLDGLRERFAEYVELGAHFAKWRAVIRIGADMPTDQCLRANSHALARYAALCQEAGLVPIVEPEVLMDGDHTLQRCEAETARALDQVFTELEAQRVRLDGIVLKPNMVLAGSACPDQPDAESVVSATLRCLQRCVPPSVPGIAFLSGGQSDEAATHHLNALNQRESQDWSLTFSFGRALLAPTLGEWRGDQTRVGAAQATLAHRARCNAAATEGRYGPEMEQDREPLSSM